MIIASNIDNPAKIYKIAGLSAGQFFGFVAMIFGMFMAILDIQIVASSLAEIQAGLSASRDEISWVQTSYLIAEVVMIPLSGYLSRLLSTRVLFTLSALGFTAASLACGLANSLGEMIFWRALQGFLGGAMIPTVFAALFMLFSPQRRAMMSVVIGLVATIAPTIGPTLGGYVTQSLSWHWLFLLNILPGLVVALAVWRLVDIDKPDWRLLKQIDGLGLVLMALFLGTLEYVVEEGPRQDWLEDEAVRNCAIICALSGLMFFWRMFTAAQPIVDLSAYRDRNFALGSLFSFILGIGLYGAVYLLPLFLAQVRHYDSLQIGQVMFVVGLFQLLAAPIAGPLSQKLDLRVMLAIGLGLFGLGVWHNSHLTAQSSLAELFFGLALRGFSLMFCFVPINTLALGTLPLERLKNASGLYNLMRNLGGAIGLALINTVLIERLAHHQHILAANINSARPAIAQGLQGLTEYLAQDPTLAAPENTALKLLAGLVSQEAAVLSFADSFLLMAGLFFAALLFMPFVRLPKSSSGDSHEAGTH
jgi:MFS transporter, DHA2 family, multidrug resistance protein